MRKILNLLSKSGHIVCIAFLVCGLLLTGCDLTRYVPEQTPPADIVSNAENTDNTGASATAESSHITESTQAPESIRETDDSAAASLVAFRQALVGTPQKFAVAYFGYVIPDGGMPADPYAVMEGTAPQLCENLPFLLQIPKENVVGTEGNLFCVVPTDENATVAVNCTPWDEATETYGEEEVLYRSEKGDPILLMTRNTAWCLETEVIITDSIGNVTVWYPFIGEDNRIAPLYDDNDAGVYRDYSPYDRLDYENLMGGAPEEMVGTWTLAWTEVDGERVAYAADDCTVEITTDGADAFWFSYTDENYPAGNLTDRELLVSPGELYADCGNNQWFAEVYATSDDLTYYAVALLNDGTLLVQYGWEVDGMPMVGYAWYEKTD